MAKKSWQERREEASSIQTETEQICWNVGDVVDGNVDNLRRLCKLLKSIRGPGGAYATAYGQAVRLQIALCEIETLQKLDGEIEDVAR